MPKHLTTNDSSSFVAETAVGAANGVAPLGADSKIPATFLPSSGASSVLSVNGKTGTVLLTASDVGSIASNTVGNPNGVAPLDALGRLPVNKLPTSAVQTVNGYSGPAVTLAASDLGAISQTTADGRYAFQDSLYYNAKNHGAVIDGTTDDAPAINALLASVPAGATVYLSQGDVAVGSPIVVPPGKTLKGPRRNLMKAGLYDPAVRIKPLSTFTGPAVIQFLDQATGSYSGISAEQRVENVMIYGANAPAGVDGIQAKGNVQNVELSCVTVRDMPGNGIYTGANAGAYPYSWRLFKVMLDNNHGHGATFQLMTDLTMIDCQAIGNWANGFILNNTANSQLSSCRAEWNGNHGYYITGNWGTGQGSGGMQMTGCGTDRNGYNGVFVDATGNGPIVISNLMTRRDGRNGGTGGGGYAGLAATGATVPLVVGDWTNYPGVDDGGAGTNSPQYGGSFTGNTSVQIDNAYLHADTAGIHDGGGNTVFQLGANVAYASGTTASPTRTTATGFEVVVAASNSRTKKGADFVCTGTNDQTVIQQAIDLVNGAPGKGIVRLTDGTFNLSATISIPNGAGLSIIGSGWGTVLRVANGTNIWAMTFAGPNDTRHRFANFMIDGNCLNQTTGGGGIYAVGAVWCVFEYIHFSSCWQAGLYLGAQPVVNAFGHNNSITRCLFDQSTGSSGLGQGIYLTSNDENQITFCDFEYLGGSGAGTATAILDLAGTQQIVSCNFVNGANNAYGVRCQDAAANTKIVACNFDGMAGDCVFLATTNCVVSDCTFFEIGIAGVAGNSSGVHLEYAAQNNSIHGNTLASSATNGQTRSLIREENVGGSGNNYIYGNTLITKGTMTVGALDLNAPNTVVRGNKGGGVNGDPVVLINTLVRNVKDYGAKGDNATDDTAAIQAAIDALGSQGGVVFLPPGNYLLNGANPLNLNEPITLMGAGHGATTIRIGAAFTGSSAITIGSDDCMIQGLQLRGASSTTTSNPACHGVTVTGAQETRIFDTTLQYINGYAVRLFGTAATTLHGTQLNMVKIQSCAGGIHIKSDSTATAANVQLSNVFTRFLGVNSGANANLDGIRIEDSWDILAQNVMPWMQATQGGTGAALRVVGDCAAIFVQNLDALGPQTGAANVVIESNANGSPQNVQIAGGVIQQGIIGLLISGASNQVRVRNMRVLNNQTHNISVTSTGFGIYLDECLISQGGAGATGTNYDVNWTGSAEGFITDCRFGSSVVATGTAGVQGIVNIASGTVVRVVNANFAGTGSTSTNWYPTTQPQMASRVDGTNYEVFGNVDHRFASGQRYSFRPSASGNHVAAINVAGADTVDRLRLYADRLEIGPGGTTARDVTWGRQGAGQVGTPDSDILIGQAGKTLYVKTGTNAKMGTVTANGTTAVTVSSTAVTSTGGIFLGMVTPGGTPGAAYVSAKTAGTSFQIKSVAGDTSTYLWWIVEPA